MFSLGELIDGIVQLLPVPKTIMEFVWTGIGWQLGHSFATLDGGLDETIEAKWSIGRIGKAFLNFIHHWWIGGLMLTYFGVLPVAVSLNLPVQIPVYPCAEAFWFGLGMFAEDSLYHIKESMKDGKLSKIIPSKKKIIS